MKFSTIFFKEGDSRMQGLKTIDISSKPLGNVVALVGRNGSGKSRVLNLIANYANLIIVDDFLRIRIENLSSPSNTNFNFSGLENLIKEYKTSKGGVKTNILAQIQNNFLPPYKAAIAPYIKLVNLELLTKLSSSKEKNSFENLFQKTTVNNDFNSLFTNETIAYLQSLSDELNLDRYNNYFDGNDKLEEKKSYIKFEKFQFFVNQFLGKKISSRAKKIEAGQAFSSSLMWNDHLFNPNYLSPGEKILFSYAILFYLLDINSKNGIENCIIIIDEPENHLHPSAQIQLITAIKNIIKDKGQLWIATHSLPLISSLEYDEIFLVKNDEVFTPNRYNPGNSINELMESEINSYRMKEFLNSSSEWAYSNFMIQCFLEPEVYFQASNNDPQISKLTELIKSKPKLKILDFGAGKGRLARSIQDNTLIQQKIEYFGVLEPNDIFFEELKGIPIIKEVFTNEDSIPSDYFDVILLVNVLHEINPEKWEKIFEKIRSALNSEGVLVIVEDKFLPKGERIEKYGYLILNELQILDLFGILHDQENIYNPLSKANDNRITFSVIPKDKINVSNESIILAIENLNKEIFGKMEEIRSKMDKDVLAKKDLSLGRRYAHYTQLYINTSLALKYLPIEFKSKNEETSLIPSL